MAFTAVGVRVPPSAQVNPSLSLPVKKNISLCLGHKVMTMTTDLHVKKNGLPLILGIILLLHSPGYAAKKTKLPPRFNTWLNEEVVYIITSLERQVFNQLKNDRERDLFIEAFWKQRDPTKGTPENEFKTEHYRRLNYVNKYYGRNTPKPGWMTDRGRVYIILGPPRDTQRFEGKSQVYNSEVWFYQGMSKLGLPAGFNLVFFQKSGTGEYKLYSPLRDGPQALLTSYYGDPMDYMAAYQRLREFAPELAQVSLSLIPGEENTAMGRPTLSSDILIQKVESTPSRQVKERYAQKFLEYKDSIDVEYSVNYMSSSSMVKVFKTPGGGYYVHYAIEPDRLSVNQYNDKFYTNLTLNGTVAQPDGRLIYQFEKKISLEFNEEQIKTISSQPVSIRDMFPLIPGRFKISILMKNEVSKEFTSLERDLLVPSPKDTPQMTSLLLGYRVKKVDPAQSRLRPFQVGAFEVYAQPNRVFLSSDTLFLGFQVPNLDPAAREKGTVKIRIEKNGKEFRILTKKLTDNPGFPDFLESWNLKDFPPAHYNLEIFLEMDGKPVLSRKEEFDVTHLKAISRPWYYNKLMPGLNDPIHSYIMGSQLFNSRRPQDAVSFLEKAFHQKPESYDFASSLARCYLLLKKYQEVEKVLAPFADGNQAMRYNGYLILSRTYQALSKWAEAVRILDKAVSRFGINVQILNTLGTCYFQMGNLDEALAAWEKSLEINPKQSEIQKMIKTIKEKK